MAVDTTWSMFVQLLKEALDSDTSLSDTMKAGLKARADVLSNEEMVSLDADSFDSSTGAVTLDEANDAITVATSVSESTIIWSMMTFETPIRVDGTMGDIGALVGHVGQGLNSPVANADISLSYRFSTSEAWKAFSRTVVLDEVSTIQFRATIAAQGSDADMPQLHVWTEQL